MDYPPCENKTCIQWKNSHCSMREPEKCDNSCLDFEDALDFFRLKADALKGSLR